MNHTLCPYILQRVAQNASDVLRIKKNRNCKTFYTSFDLIISAQQTVQSVTKVCTLAVL